MIFYKNKDLKINLEERLVFDAAGGATAEASIVADDSALVPEGGVSDTEAIYDKRTDPDNLKPRETIIEETDDYKISTTTAEFTYRGDNLQAIGIIVSIKNAENSDIDFMRLDINTEEYEFIFVGTLRMVEGAEHPRTEVTTDSITMDTNDVKDFYIYIFRNVDNSVSDFRLRLDSQEIGPDNRGATVGTNQSASFIAELNSRQSLEKDFLNKNNQMTEYKPNPRVIVIESPEMLIQETRKALFGIQQGNASLTEETLFNKNKTTEGKEEIAEDNSSEDKQKRDEFYRHMLKNMLENKSPESIHVITNEASNYDIGVNLSLTQDYNPKDIQNIIFSKDSTGNMQFESIPFEQFLIGINKDSMAEELSFGVSEGVSKTKGLHSQLYEEKESKNKEADKLVSLLSDK